MLVVSFFFGLYGFEVYAQVEGRLLSQSSSGQTAVFNLGKHDSVAEGDYAVLVKEIGEEGAKKLRVVPVAKARNIKTSIYQSVWVLYHIYDPKLLKIGDKYSVFTDRNILKGQVDPKVSQTTLIVDPENKSEVVKSYLVEDKNRLAKKQDSYKVNEVIHGPEIISNTDFNLVDVDEWRQQNKTRYRSSIFKSSRPQDFMNEYEHFLYEQSKVTGLEAKMYKEILDRGEAWSEDFTDEELSRVLNQVSILDEKERRDQAASRPFAHSVSFEYGKILTNAQSDNDLTYMNKDLKFYGLDFEFFPFLKLQKFDKFSISVNPQYTNSAFFATQRNVNLTHYSSTFGFNWYLNQIPYKIHFPILFVGAFGRIGYGTASSPLTSDQAKYNVISVPGLRAGAKMNFKNRLSLRLVTTIETLKLERYEINKTGTYLDERYNLLESKLVLALSYLY